MLLQRACVAQGRNGTAILRSPAAATLSLHTLAAVSSRALPAPARASLVRPRGHGLFAAASILPTAVHFGTPCRRSSSSSSGSRGLSAQEKAVLKVLQSIRHPSAGASGDDIVFSGHVRSVSVSADSGVVNIVLPLDDAYRALKKQIIDKLESKPHRPDWLQGVRVVMESVNPKDKAAAPTSGSSRMRTDGLANVRHIIAVSSCKGGVGKSTVAVNLAYALQQLQISEPASGAAAPLVRDARVGLLDADIYGPSLPTMVRPRDTTLRYDDDRRIQPPIYNGVKTMSYGYVKGQSTDLTQAGAGTSADSSGAFIRGPLASSAVKQLASETAWGSLDFLVVDFPPGTGDIQLTLTQSLRIAGAVVVTTPGKLSFVDVAKGLALFQRTGVPVMALVENMSYFVCGNCDTKHRLFGERGAEYLAQLQARFGGGSVVGGSPTTDSNGSSSSEQQQLQSFPPPFPVLELPIWPAMARASDEGDPIMLSHDDANKPVRDVYAELARSVQQRLMGAQGEGAAAVPTLTFDAKSGHVVLTDPASSSAAASDSTAAASSSSSPAARSVSLPARSLRLACRCAGCVDELSGKPRLDPARVPADVRPIGMQPRGNYAVAVHWSDGHASSLYPFEDIRKLAAQASSA